MLVTDLDLGSTSAPLPTMSFVESGKHDVSFEATLAPLVLSMF